MESKNTSKNLLELTDDAKEFLVKTMEKGLVELKQKVHEAQETYTAAIKDFNTAERVYNSMINARPVNANLPVTQEVTPDTLLPKQPVNATGKQSRENLKNSIRKILIKGTYLSAKEIGEKLGENDTNVISQVLSAGFKNKLFVRSGSAKNYKYMSASVQGYIPLSNGARYWPGNTNPNAKRFTMLKEAVETHVKNHPNTTADSCFKAILKNNESIVVTTDQKLLRQSIGSHFSRNKA